jgi:hypothetical protein
MKTLTALAILALMSTGPGAAAALAQDDQPKSGKIGNVEREAREARRNNRGGHDDDDDGGGGVSAVLHVIFSYPREPGQGYDTYPYRHPDKPFVRDSVLSGRRFWTVAGHYFADDESTLRGGQLTLEAANGMWAYGIEYTQFVEPLAGRTDRLHTGQVMLGVLPGLGRTGYVRFGVTARGLLTDQGDAAGGPGLELGVQLFPRRPFGINALGRVALMSWDYNSSFLFADVQVGASVFLGPLELQAGYRRMQIGEATAFNGPTLGLRLWF